MGCMKRCNASTPTCLVYVGVFRVLAGHMARVMIGSYFTCTFSIFTFPLPRSPRNTGEEHGMSHIMCKVAHARQTTAIHEWMLAISIYRMHMQPISRRLHGRCVWRVFLRGVGCPSR